MGLSRHSRLVHPPKGVHDSKERRARFARAASAAAVLVLSSATALAFPSGRLIYARDPGTESCPDESVVRRAVSKRLGYDPFFASADKTIIVTVAREPERLAAHVRLVDASGTVQGLRDLTAPRDRCDDLVAALALSISIAIDPASADRPTPPSADVDEPPPVPLSQAPVPTAAPPPAPPPAKAAAPPLQKPEPDRPAAAPLVWQLGAGGFGSIAAMPSARVGGLVYGQLRADAFALGLELALDAPSSSEIEGATFKSSSIALALYPCLRFGVMFGCAMGQVGRMSAEGTNAPSGPGNGLLVRSGVRLEADLLLDESLVLRLHSDLLATLAAVRITSDQTEIWKTPLLSGTLGVAVGVLF
jgi:hypothetical protein